MLVIKIEMWPRGNHAKARPLGVATIANVGGDAKVGDYECRLFKSPEYSKNAETRPLHEMLTKPLAKETWRKARLNGFPRLRLGPWDLLLRALVAMASDRNAEAAARAVAGAERGDVFGPPEGAVEETSC